MLIYALHGSRAIYLRFGVVRVRGFSLGFLGLFRPSLVFFP